jgi:hypothetical protein
MQRTPLTYTFTDLATFCAFMALIGGSSDVHLTFPEHPKRTGRYLSFHLSSPERANGVLFDVDHITFHPWTPLQHGAIVGGPFPLTEATLRAVATAGVEPNDYGPADLTEALRPIAKAERQRDAGVPDTMTIEAHAIVATHTLTEIAAWASAIVGVHLVNPSRFADYIPGRETCGQGTWRRAGDAMEALRAFAGWPVTSWQGEAKSDPRVLASVLDVLRVREESQRFADERPVANAS